MARRIDISVLGDEALSKRLTALPFKVQRKLVSKSLRAAAKRAKQRIIHNLSGGIVQVRTGTLLRAFERAPIRVQSSSPRRRLRIGPEFPRREALGIRPDDKYYYPAAVEYGHGRVRARPFLREAVDKHETAEIARIASDIGRLIESEF
ncbi:MAG: hypothetical protein ACREDO_13670 [Methyloceanibacter sp.]